MKFLKLLQDEVIKYKFLFKPFLLLCIIYGLGIVSIIRANFNYIDDLGRVYNAYRGWSNWSRYISEYFSIIVQTDKQLMDISPLPQIIAILFLALASVILIYIFSNDEKISYWSILSVVPLGLCPYFLECLSYKPYFLECLSYKFDSPYMALSILASVLPFLFLKYGNKAFFITSFIGCMVMCMTYQASSGIYVLIALFLAAKKFNEGTRYFEIVKYSFLAYVSSYNFQNGFYAKVK